MSTKIIVGLTTTPIRINNIGKTLISLLSQTIIPDEIVLTIPLFSARFNTPYDITDRLLLRLIEKKMVILNKIEHDYGPATKFVGLLTRDYQSDDILICVDDDIAYKPTVIEYLITPLKNNANITTGLSGFNFYSNGMYNKVLTYMGQAEIIEGFAGVASYKKNMPIINELCKWGIRPQTHDSFIDANDIQRAQFLSDDYTISMFFKKTDIKTVIVCDNGKSHGNYLGVLEIGYKSDALHNQPGGNMYNYNLLRNMGV